MRNIPVIKRRMTLRHHASIRETGGARGAFDAEVRRAGLIPRVETTITTEPAAPNIADLFGIDVGTSMIVRARDMYASDVPVQRARSYLLHDIAHDTPLVEEDTGVGGIYSRLADLGHGVEWFSETIRVRVCRVSEKIFFNDPRNLDPFPVYETTRIASSGTEQAIEVCVSVFPVSRWELEYAWEAR